METGMFETSLASLALIHSSEERQRLVSVYQKVEENCRVEIVCRFQEKALRIIADEDRDTVVVICEDHGAVDFDLYACVGNLLPWKPLLGSLFGWGWLTIGHFGHADGVVLSFDGAFPQLLLSVIASSIHIFEVRHQEKEGGERGKRLGT